MKRQLRTISRLVHMMSVIVEESRSQFRKVLMDGHGGLTKEALSILEILRGLDLTEDDLDVINHLIQLNEEQRAQAIPYSLTAYEVHDVL